MSRLRSFLGGRARAASGPVVVFPHIPKTAGQTVISELRRVLGEAAHSPVRTHAAAPEDAQMPPGYRLYAGHIDWVDLETLPDNRFAFTLLRDPYERIASFYFYLLREAAKLTPEEMATKARTNMRMISTRSADDYFFGGDRPWQRFVLDHYDNFQTAYLATGRIRGAKQIDTLPRSDWVGWALSGAQRLQGIYGLNDLDRLESDLAARLGTTVNLTGNFVNAGPDLAPDARAGTRPRRWPDLVARFEQDGNAARLERFAETDADLIEQLGMRQ